MNEEAEVDRPPPGPAFGVAKAFGLWGLFLLAQGVGFVGFALVLVTLEAVTGKTILLEQRPGLAILSSAVVSALAVFGAAIKMAGPRLITSGAPTGFGWCRPRPRMLAIGFIAGFGTVAFALGLDHVFPFPTNGLSKFGKLLVEPGFGRLLAILLAIGFAPLVEEFLFRGALLAGFRSRLGRGVSILSVSALFVLLHLLDGNIEWPRLLSHAVFAGVLAVLRESSGSLFPSVAAHFSHNAAVMGLGQT